MMSRRASAVVIVALVTIALLASMGSAFAAPSSALPMHSRLLKAAPADDSEVETAEEVVLTFNEDVDPQFVKMTVVGPEGSETDGDPTVDGRVVTQALAADLPAGKHTATYRVVSADGHPISGKVSFTTTLAPSPSPTATPSATPSATPTPTATPSATPTVAPDPASDDAGTGGVPWWAWLLGGLVALAGLYALSVRWKHLGGPEEEAEQNARADAEEAARETAAGGSQGSSGAPRDGRDDPFA